MGYFDNVKGAVAREKPLSLQHCVDSAATVLPLMPVVGELSKPVSSTTSKNVTNVTIGRWMSESEYKAMISTGKLQESFSGTTHVAFPAAINAFNKQAKLGPCMLNSMLHLVP